VLPPLGFLPRLVLASTVAGSVCAVTAASQASTDVAAVVARVGERVAAYYERARQIVCIERSTVIPIDGEWSSQGFARTVESELRVETDAMGDGNSLEPRVTRVVRSVNGREPRERDKKDRAGCNDPTPVSPEPLAFLLPGEREAYRFTNLRETTEQGRAALTIDFLSATRSSRPELIEDEYGHDDCFDWTGSPPIDGRIWVDAVSYDVLRLERHVSGPTDVRVPAPLQWKYGFPLWVTIQRDDLTLRYTEVAFTDPDERLLLPSSVESLTIFRTGLQSIRRTQTFSDYRRFLAETKIIKPLERPPQ
jgi:hypothetical protein